MCLKFFSFPPNRPQQAVCSCSKTSPSKQGFYLTLCNYYSNIYIYIYFYRYIYIAPYYVIYSIEKLSKALLNFRKKNLMKILIISA